MTKLALSTLGALLVTSILSTPASALPVTTDLWDIAQGASVTSHSGVLGNSHINNMFGGTTGVEPGNTLFRDWQAVGTVHSVEWQTAATETLRSINLYSQYDGGVNRDAHYRGFSLFTLFGWNTSGSIWDQIYQLAPIDANHRLISAYADPSFSDRIDYAVDVTAYTTNKFRAEFTQYGGPGNASGPRIMELDGFSTFVDGSNGGNNGSVPEPSALVLMTIGLLGLTFSRRLKRSQVLASS